jgi:hypothetical protein
MHESQRKSKGYGDNQALTKSQMRTSKTDKIAVVLALANVSKI